FFEYFDWSTWEMFESVLGVPRQDLFTTYDIIGVPLVDAQARFHVPVKFGDFLDIASEIGEFRRSSFDVTHRMTLAGELAVEGRVGVLRFLDAAGPSALGLDRRYLRCGPRPRALAECARQRGSICRRRVGNIVFHDGRSLARTARLRVRHRTSIPAPPWRASS